MTRRAWLGSLLSIGGIKASPPAEGGLPDGGFWTCDSVPAEAIGYITADQIGSGTISTEAISSGRIVTWVYDCHGNVVRILPHDSSL